MLFENISVNVDSVHNPMCYVRRCEGFADLVLEIQGLEFALRSPKIFRAYQVLVAKRSQLFLESGLTKESQLRLQEHLNPHICSTASFETVYKALLVGDGSQLVTSNPAFHFEYRNILRTGDIYAEGGKVDPGFLSFEEDPNFEAAARKGVGKGMQYLANL